MLGAVPVDLGGVLPGVRLVQTVVQNFCRKWSSVYVVQFLSENICLLAESLLHFCSFFIEIFVSRTQHI